MLRDNLRSLPPSAKIWLPDSGRWMGHRPGSIPKGSWSREGSWRAGSEHPMCKPEGICAEMGNSVKRQRKWWGLHRPAPPALRPAPLPIPASALLRARTLQPAPCRCLPCLQRLPCLCGGLVLPNCTEKNEREMLSYLAHHLLC